MKAQKQKISINPIKLVILAVALFATGAFNSRGQLAASIVQQAYLKASNTGGPSTGEPVGDNFGGSVAISGDTIVIGALLEDSNATGINGNQTNNSARDSGAAYVFVRDGTNWVQQAYLKASNTGANDLFGWSVAISGETMVIGAPVEDSNATGVNGNQTNNSATDSGAGYVFVRDGTNWVQQAYLKASNTGAEDRFGLSVAISGDTVVVGAGYESSNATGVNGNQGNNSASTAGAAYVFVRSVTNWTQQAYLKASNTGAGDWFGISVAVSGDTIVIGATREDSNATGVNGNQTNNSATDSGAAYVFVRDGTNWIQQAYLKASNTGAGDHFGPVAISGDTLVVGALLEGSKATGVNGNQSDNTATEAGAAYIFVRNGTNWSQQAYLKASNTRTFDGFFGEIPNSSLEFGISVAISGDTVDVGAPGDFSNATGVNGNQSNTNAPLSGAAYVFAGLGAPAALPTQFIYTTNDGTITIGGYTGTNGVVVIPDTVTGLPVTAIGESAFSDTGLTSVTIPNSVRSIGNWAFVRCTSLTNVTIPNSVTFIGWSAFSHCHSLTSVTIPNSVTNIEVSAFVDCTSLTSVTIPNSVTTIGSDAFGYCTSLTAISVETNNPAYSSVSGVLFDKSQTTLIEYPGGKVGSYSIPNSVTSIEGWAFYGCSSLTSVTIPNSVTNIGESAFSGCTNLASVYFQGDAPSVGSSVFSSDNKATAYYLPGTTGWGSKYSGIPTALWSLPYPLILNSSLGVRSNEFGFTVWATNASVVVEASADLNNPKWSPVQTNVLNNGVVNFTDPEWNKNPSRFYRVRSQ